MDLNQFVNGGTGEEAPKEAPTADDYREYCRVNGHLEASIAMSNDVVCARCTEPMQDKASHEQGYTVMWNEPTPLTPNRR